MDITEFKVEVFLPEETVDEMTQELNGLGALTVGDYDYVFSLTKVMGHWRPLEGSNPYRGTRGEISSSTEYKMEFSCPRALLQQVLVQIHEIHPYEEPIVNVLPLVGSKKEG